MEKPDAYLTIKEAAAFLGVSSTTLCNWGREGKIREQRHSVNNYRLYKPDDLDPLFYSAEKSVASVNRPR